MLTKTNYYYYYYTEFDFNIKHQYKNICPTHLISCSALLRFMYCLTVCCTNGPKGEQNISTAETKLPFAQKTMNKVYDLLRLVLGLTPAVGHDLEGQRQEVIKGCIQH